MISQLERQIVFRYLKTKKKDGFLNIISTFSFIGISLGVAVLIIVMSVMNGFRAELVDKIVGFNSHIIIQSNDIENDLKLTNSENIKNLSSSTLESSMGEVVLINKNFTKGLSLRGYKVNDFKKLEIFKNIDFSKNNKIFDKNNISIGKELSFDLGLNVGDNVLLMSPIGEDTIIGNLPKQEVYKISYIFDSGLLEFDQNVAFVNINSLANLLNQDTTNRNICLLYTSTSPLDS